MMDGYATHLKAPIGLNFKGPGPSWLGEIDGLQGTSVQSCKLTESNRKAMNRNWSNQKTNPALKTKTENK